MQLAATVHRHNMVHFNCLIEGKILIVHENAVNQNFHLGRYIAGYTFGNHVLRLRLLRHKAGQEGRGEILLENSFMR